MSDTASLRDIALEITGDGTVTEEQQEGHSHDPVGDEEAEIAAAAAAASHDGLSDALDGLDAGDGAAAD
jgi:hypothetical protein